MTTTTGDITRSRAVAPFRRIGLVAAGTLVGLVAALVAVAVGAPAAGTVLGVALVVGNRLVQGLVERVARDATPTVQLGAHGFSMIGRALAVALTLFFVGASLSGAGSDQPIGLDRPDLAGTALVIFFLGFTTDMAVEVLRRLGEHATAKAVAPDATTTEPAA